MRPIWLPALLGLAALNLGAAPPAPAARGEKARPNVLIISVESLRSDRLGCYTGGARKTPSIDALAARGARFERAYAASPSTAASAATLLTGVLPARHGLRHDLGGRLEDGVGTLAAMLKGAGYRTGAVIGSFHLDSDRGLDRGFDSYDDEMKGVVKKFVVRSKERRADEVTKQGLLFLDSVPKGTPFFLWLDFYDPHFDYDPPEPWKTEYANDLYQGEVANVDSGIGAFVKELQARGLEERTAIVLAATHGEGLGDHRETGHGIYLYETTIRVPLIVLAPGPRGAGGRSVGTPVGLVDVLPTILEMTGSPIPKGLDGYSLLPLVSGSGKAPSARPCFIEAVQPHEAYGWSALFGMIDGYHKVVSGQRLEAFDLKSDPGEEKPLEKAPSWAATLESQARPLLGTFDPPPEERRKILEEANAIGMPWAENPLCLEKGKWPDPRDKDRVDLNQTLFEAQINYDQTLYGYSGRSGSQVLESDPANLSALEFVVWLAMRGRYPDMMLEPLELIQCGYPYRASSYHWVAHYYEKIQNFEKEEKALRLFGRIEPWNEDWEYDLAALYAMRDMKDECFEHLKKAIALGSTDYDVMRHDPRFMKVRSDPRFAELVGPVAAPPALPRPSSN